MAKKKLFGNVKEPRCETCALGKLSANGESVLCVQGGAVPLDHSCRRYQYDPLRRVPKRRPQLGDFSAADFALDDVQATPPVALPVEEATPSPEQSTFEHLFAYLDEHETPDADTIRAILNKTYVPETKADDEVDETSETEDETTAETDVVPDVEPEAEEDPDITVESENEPESEESVELTEEEWIDRIVKEAVEAKTALAPDNTVDIDEDLARLDLKTVPDYARAPLPETNAPAEPLILSDDATKDVGLITDLTGKVNAPLSVDDLLFLPRNTPSDHDDVEDLGGFTPLTGNE